MTNKRYKYIQYMNSFQWRALRLKVINRDDRKCRCCDTRKNLTVHHLTYDRFMNEKMDDLITLCETCHKRVHEGKITITIRLFNHGK